MVTQLQHGNIFKTKIGTDCIFGGLIFIKKLNDHALDAMRYAHERLGFLENCVGGNETDISNEIKIHQKYLKILEGKDMKKDKIYFRMEQNQDVPQQILMYLRDNKVDNALLILKYGKETLEEKIAKVIKILEEPIELNNKEFHACTMTEEVEEYIQTDINNTKELVDNMKDSRRREKYGRSEFQNSKRRFIERLKDFCKNRNNRKSFKRVKKNR